MNAHVQDRLSAYLDGELGAADRAAVDVHLRACGACARHLEELAAVDAAARELPVGAPPGYFASFPARVRHRLPPRRARRPPAWMWAAAAGLVLAILTPLTLRRTSPRVPEASRTDEASRLASAPPATALPPPAKAPAAGGAREKAAPEKKDGYRLRRPAAPSAPVFAEPPRDQAASVTPSSPPQVQRRSGPWAQNQAPAAPAAVAAAPGASPAQAAARAEEDQKEATPPSRREAARVGKLEQERAQARPMLTDALEARADDESERYRALLARRPGSSEEARRLRDAWRAFAEAYPAGEQADEARVQAVEAGVLAFRLGHDRRDRDRARADARAYLARPDAAQAARVRALLEELAR